MGIGVPDLLNPIRRLKKGRIQLEILGLKRSEFSRKNYRFPGEQSAFE